MNLSRRMFTAVPFAFALPAIAQTATPRRLIIIGGTARTAEDLIPQALWRGYSVVAVARRPERVRFKPSARLRIVKADILDIDALGAAFSGLGDEVVLSVVGPRNGSAAEIPESDLMSKGLENLIVLMKRNGNRRLILSSSASVERVHKLGYTATTPKPSDLKMEDGSLWYYNMRGPYNDMGRMEQIALASGLEATALRVGFLVKEPALGDLSVAIDTEIPIRRLVTYPDYAAYMLDSIDDASTYNRIIGVFGAREMIPGVNLDLEAEMKEQRAILEQVKSDLKADPKP